MPASLGPGSPYKTQSSRGASLMPPTQPNHLWLTKSFHAFRRSTLASGWHKSSKGRLNLHDLSSTHSTRQHIETHQAFSHRLPGQLQPSTQGCRDLAAHVVFEVPLLPARWRVCLSLLCASCAQWLQGEGLVFGACVPATL